MKYKFSIPARIKSTVEWQLEHYPEDRRQMDEYIRDMIPSPTQGYSLTAGVDGGEAGRATENVTLRIISSPYLRWLETSCNAIEAVLRNLGDIDLELVKLVYWRREFTVEGAGMKLNLSKSSAYRHINTILTAIAGEMGYVSL